MAVSIGSTPNRAQDRGTSGRRFDITAEQDVTLGAGNYGEYQCARINGAFAGGGGADANSVTIEHSWDGITWVAAGNATVSGNVVAQAIVEPLRPWVRIVIASAAAATFTGTVDLL